MTDARKPGDELARKKRTIILGSGRIIGVAGMAVALLTGATSMLYENDGGFLVATATAAASLWLFFRKG